jgi:hypothetical protein
VANLLPQHRLLGQRNLGRRGGLSVWLHSSGGDICLKNGYLEQREGDWRVSSTFSVDGKLTGFGISGVEHPKVLLIYTGS